MHAPRWLSTCQVPSGRRGCFLRKCLFCVRATVGGYLPSASVTPLFLPSCRTELYARPFYFLSPAFLYVSAVITLVLGAVKSCRIFVSVTYSFSSPVAWSPSFSCTTVVVNLRGPPLPVFCICPTDFETVKRIHFVHASLLLPTV